MTTDDSSKTVLQSPEGDEIEVEVGPSESITCPECSSDNIEVHTLDRTLAGECHTCFNVWKIGNRTDWEVDG